MVIGIIALLIGILLPVLSKAREAANTLVCATHLREIGMASFTYAADNKGKLPIPIGGGANGNLTYSAILMKPDNSFWGQMDFGKGTLSPFLQSARLAERLFSCPSDSDPRWGSFQPVTADPFVPLTPSPATTRNFSYAFNAKLDGDIVLSDYSGIKISEIRRPSEKFLVHEAFMPSNANVIAVIYNVDNIPSTILLSFRHGGKSNQCFADGHVELFDPSILRDNTVTDPYKSRAFLRYILPKAQ